MKPKLYTSELWLRRELYRNHKSPEKIAAEQGVSKATIYNHMRKFGLK